MHYDPGGEEHGVLTHTHTQGRGAERIGFGPVYKFRKENTGSQG